MFFLRALSVALIITGGSLSYASPIASAQPAVDPQSLIGEWEGQWKGVSGYGQFGGRLYLTIEKVDGDKVFGKTEFTGPSTSSGPLRSGSGSYKWEGRVEGNVLKLVSEDKDVSGDYTISGSSMTVNSTRKSTGTRSEGTLNKKK